jgi:hypothetical protein
MAFQQLGGAGPGDAWGFRSSQTMESGHALREHPWGEMRRRRRGEEMQKGEEEDDDDERRRRRRSRRRRRRGRREGVRTYPRRRKSYKTRSAVLSCAIRPTNVEESNQYPRVLPFAVDAQTHESRGPNLRSRKTHTHTYIHTYIHKITKLTIMHVSCCGNQQMRARSGD